VPGSGEIDFEALKPFLKTDTIKVIELKPAIQVSEVKEGIRFIREKLSDRINMEKARTNEYGIVGLLF
jgi:hypothetical protein